MTFDFTIQVPRQTRLRLCTVNGREVLITGTRGDFELDNVNGRITMENVDGSGSARTINGAIVASFSERPRAASAFKTTNGDVVIAFPADLAADLKMKTFNGGLFTDFDVASLPQPVAVAERSNGRFVYRSNQFTLVRAGGGGPDLTFETFNGDVRVLSCTRRKRTLCDVIRTVLLLLTLSALCTDAIGVAQTPVESPAGDRSPQRSIAPGNTDRESPVGRRDDPRHQPQGRADRGAETSEQARDSRREPRRQRQ